MKNTVLPLILFLCILFFSSHLYAGHNMHPLNQISYVKKKIQEQQEPYYTAYRQLIHYADSIQDVPQNALVDFAVPGFYDKPEEHRANSLALQRDAFAAYCSALAYQLSGEERYGKKACYFLNAWASVNKKCSEHDGVLVMTYSGSALLMAAELMMDTQVWAPLDKDAFKSWVAQVYQKAVNEIRVHKNNWADWGRFGSLLAASLLDDKEEVARNVQLIKSDLFVKIAEDGHMPEEVIRGNNGIWYTYFSLAPMTAACWLVYNLTGENLFVWEHNGTSIKKALDYLSYFHQKPSEWKWNPQPNLGTHETWPDNLLEAMAGIYNDASYLQYVESSRPHIYPLHHFAWSFPTLMPLSLSGYDLTDNNTWANYNRYEVANKTVKNPVAVFMGNSITESWSRNRPDFFTQNKYVGRGISGQVTAQMLARFRADVLDLKPQVVCILAGTNDIAQNCMYMSVENIAGNIFSMAELAKANGIKVIICSVLPATHYSWRPAVRNPAGQIIQLNKLLKEYAQKNKITYIDFHSLMKDEHDGLPPKYSRDGVHPTSEGFSVMEPIIKEALLSCTSQPAPESALPFGVNLAGAEFFHKKMDGVGRFGVDYHYPTVTELDYWKSKGLTLIRLPFKWERIQHELYGELNREEIDYIKYLLDEAGSRDMKILIDMHNYGRRKDNGKDRIIGDSVSIDHFASVWEQIAGELKGHHALYGYGLVNEPHDMLDSVPWFNIAQTAIEEIRKVDPVTAIVVGGNHWSSAARWQEVSDDLKNLYDPSDNLIFEGHCYFDEDGSGIYRRSYDEEKAYPTIGIDRTRPFVEWLKANNLRGFIGEYGVPADDERWLVCLDNFLNYLSKENINGTYWAAGAQWNKYILSVHPDNNYKTDKTQLEVLTKYLKTNN